MMSKEGRLFSYSRCLAMKDARAKGLLRRLVGGMEALWAPPTYDGATLERCFCPLPSYSVSAYLVPNRPSSSRPNLGSGVADSIELLRALDMAAGWDKFGCGA